MDKYRYVFHHQKDGDYQYETLTLDEIQTKATQLIESMAKDGYALISRDRWTGKKCNYTGKDIWMNDRIKGHHTMESKNDFTAKVGFEDSSFGLWVEIRDGEEKGNSEWWAFNELRGYKLELIGNTYEP